MSITTDQCDAILSRLAALLPDETDNALLTQLVNDAADQACAWTNRTAVVDGMLRSIGDLAIVAYNRRGTEGESSRSEGGESYNFEVLPKEIYDTLAQFRLARAGGRAHETAKTTEAD